VRVIQNSCDTQGALASLSNEEVGRIFKEKCQRNVDGMIEGYKKPKVIKIALDNHDLNACNLLKTIDGCVMAYVEKFKEIEACDVLDSKDDCVTTFAIDSQDSTACNSLIDNTSCITSYSLEFKEPNTCFQAIDSQICLEGLVTKIGATVCNLMSSEKIEDCKIKYLSSPIRSDDYDSEYSECVKGLSMVIIKSGCRLKSLNFDGITTAELLNLESNGKIAACKNLKFTHTYPEENSMDYCIAAYGAALNDLSMCDSAGVAKTDCYRAVAWTDSSMTLKSCERLEEERPIAKCYPFVVGRTMDRSICESGLFPDTNFFNNCNLLIDKWLAWEKTHNE